MSLHRPLALLVALFCSGCDGGVSLLLSLAAGAAVGSWWARHKGMQRALNAAPTPLRALSAGQQRSVERQLRGELALVEAGEAVSLEREWLARSRLGGLLVSQWRLDEARALYTDGRAPQDPRLASLTAFGRHEIDLLTQSPDLAKLERIRQDKAQALALAPRELSATLMASWSALEGLCLIRMGRAREGVGLVSPSLISMAHCPSRVVYHYHLGQALEHLHEIPAAVEQYRLAAQAAPGTRLASEAQSRESRLSSDHAGAHVGFRQLPPELPMAPSPTFLEEDGAPDAPQHPEQPAPDAEPERPS